MREKNMIRLMLIFGLVLFLLGCLTFSSASAEKGIPEGDASKSLSASSITIIAIGNKATTFKNPNLPSGWVYGDSCTEDVFNIVNAVKNDSIKTIYLKNGPGGRTFVFGGQAPFVWLTKPKKIIGLDDRVPNDGNEVPLKFSSTVPATRIKHFSSKKGKRFGRQVFAFGTSQVSIRNIWLDSDGGAILRHSTKQGKIFLLPPNPNSDGDITIEDNVFITKEWGITLYDFESGINIRNNYINLKGAYRKKTDRVGSWTAINIDCRNPEYGTEDDVNVVGNYIKYNRARYPVFLGKPNYRSKRTSILNNTFTGSTEINYKGSIGGGNLFVHTGKGKFIVQGNLFVDLDSPDGSGIIMRGVKNCLVSKNKFKNVRFGGIKSWGSGAIYGRESKGVFTEGCKITDNDYSDSGLSGWTSDNPSGSGCVLLNKGSEGNYVAENNFPKGAGDKAICYQIKDLTMTPENPRGDNKIKDWRDDCIDSH